jgi:hypothetical protein
LVDTPGCTHDCEDIILGKRPDIVRLLPDGFTPAQGHKGQLEASAGSHRFGFDLAYSN